MLKKDFIPQKPFTNFKWRWAAKTPTEGINDPLVLLGTLFKLYSLEKKHVKFNSKEYANAMQELSADLDSAKIKVKVAKRTGVRNLFRNSGQYWKAVGLIPSKNTHGKIVLTDFGRAVAERTISKTEFSAIVIQTLTLPNERIQSNNECREWNDNKIKICPLKIILSTLHELSQENIDGVSQGWITPNELIQVIIPLSAYKATSRDYANFILWKRKNQINLNNWPNCVPGANDKRFACEFLLFLEHYGYISSENDTNQDKYARKFAYNTDIDKEIIEILNVSDEKLENYKLMQNSGLTYVAQNIDRKKYNRRNSRPHQAQFRQDLLATSDHCLVTRVKMPGLLEAAHIKPHKYNGPEEKENGILLRRDVHYLFDSGNLRIDVDGNVFISQSALEDYGRAGLPERIEIPDYVNKDYLRWRWENYDGE